MYLEVTGTFSQSVAFKLNHMTIDIIIFKILYQNVYPFEIMEVKAMILIRNLYREIYIIACAEITVICKVMCLHWHGAFSKDKEAEKVKSSTICPFRFHPQLNFSVNILCKCI